MDKTRRDAEYREREALESMKIKLFEKEIERLTKLIDEADEKAHKRRRTLITNDCTPSCGDATTNNHGKDKQQLRTLIRGRKRRGPRCCELENDQQREITKLKHQRLIAALKEIVNDSARRIEIQSVSSDIGITSENIPHLQTIVKTFTREEDTTKTQASKPTTAEAFAVESGTSKEAMTKACECKEVSQNSRAAEEPVPEVGQCKEVRPKCCPHKEKAPKAKCKEVRPRGRPRKETKQKGSESKKVTRRGCPSNETIPKAKESKKVTKRVSPRNVTKAKAEKGKIGTWLIDARKKGKRLKNGRVNSNLWRKKLAKRLRNRVTRAADWEYCEREALRSKARLQFTKEMKRIAIMLDEADEKADHEEANANFQNSSVEQFEFPTQKPPVTEFPNPTVNGVQNPIVIEIQDGQFQNFPSLNISEESTFLQSGGIGPANIEAELPLKSLQANVSAFQSSTEYQCGIDFEFVTKQLAPSDDDAILQNSNDSIIAFQVNTQPASDYDAGFAQLSSIDETPFLHNSSDLISAYIQIKAKPESNDDASSSYLQSSNESIDAVQIKTEPPSDNDPICEQLWNRYETIPLSQDSSDWISAYIEIKTEPESNDGKLQSSNDVTNAYTVE